MKALCEWIKEAEADRERLWYSLNITERFLTPEGVKAYVKILKVIEKTEPERGPDVLEKVVPASPPEARGHFLVIDCHGRPHKQIPLIRENLERILGVFVPETFYGVVRETAVYELFRSLIREELEKPKYRAMALQRTLTEDLENTAVWRRRCFRNLTAFHEALTGFDGDGVLDEVRGKCSVSFPEMGEELPWEAVTREENYDEAFCASLYPDNPPSVKRLLETRRIIEIRLQLSRAEKQRRRRLSRYERYPYDTDDHPEAEDERDEASKHRIVVEKNHLAGMKVPVIYTIGPEGRTGEINPGTLESVDAYVLIVRDAELLRDPKALRGYILLYLTYPLRMNREMKEAQLEHIFGLIRKAV